MDDITLLREPEIELGNMLNLTSMFSKKMTCSINWSMSTILIIIKQANKKTQRLNLGTKKLKVVSQYTLVEEIIIIQLPNS